MRPHELHKAEQAVKRIIEGCLFDAQEMLILTELMKVQNDGKVNPNLNGAGAGGAGVVIRNAMIARIVLLVSRCYAKPKEGDRHLHRAIELLEHSDVRSRFGADEAAVTEAIARFAALKGDHRQEKLKNFRDKFTAHLGDPADKPQPNYSEMFEFAAATVECIEKLAQALNLWDGSVEEDADADGQASAFWGPWNNGGGHRSDDGGKHCDPPRGI